MKTLTISELIDHLSNVAATFPTSRPPFQRRGHLSNVAATIGLDAPVTGWLLAKPDELKPLDVAQVTGVLAGWDKDKQRPIATLKLSV